MSMAHTTPLVIPSATRSPHTEAAMSEEVVVTDIRIPFGSMVVLILKWTLASIPAMIVLVVLGMVAAGLFAGMFGAIVGGG